MACLKQTWLVVVSGKQNMETILAYFDVIRKIGRVCVTFLLKILDSSHGGPLGLVSHKKTPGIPNQIDQTYRTAFFFGAVHLGTCTPPWFVKHWIKSIEPATKWPMRPRIPDPVSSWERAPMYQGQAGVVAEKECRCRMIYLDFWYCSCSWENMFISTSL